MKAHRTDGVSLTFALIFLAIAACWLVGQIVDLALPTVGWFVAGALILIGILGLLGALRSSRGTSQAPDASGSGASGEPHEQVDAGPDSARPHEPVSADPVTATPVTPVTAPPAADVDDRP